MNVMFSHFIPYVFIPLSLISFPFPRKQGKCHIFKELFYFMFYFCTSIMFCPASFLVLVIYLALVSLNPCDAAVGKAKKTEEELDPATVKVLSSILDSLDSFTNHRLKDLEKLRLAKPNATAAGRTKGEQQVGSLRPFDGTRRKSNITDSIKALKEGIMSHRPLKKTFGYKVTVYTSPIEEGGKDGKPVLVTQYVGGDMKPDKETGESATRRSGDLDESANNPQEEVIQSSGSVPYSVHVGGVADDEHASGAAETSDAGGFDHERKTEHQASSEKGHSRALSEKSKVEKGHDRQTHKQKEGEHHKDTDRESHREDVHSHDRGGATQQGIRERTEIEYYEREHFLDTDYDKEKSGHAKSRGLKEHEKHSDHDSHDRTREHVTHDSATGEHDSKSSMGHSEKHKPAHYSPPYGAHYKDGIDYAVPLGAAKAHDASSFEAQKEHGAHSEKNSASSKGHKEHNHERDHQSTLEDSGYQDNDKGRRKEGYRERGYKITAEREYFLNDAHHDTGHGKHRSGERSRDREGVRHEAKEGERDRGFVKEHKSHDSHDAAFDAKERKYHDGEKHSEGFSKTAASSSTEDRKQKHVDEIPPSDVYVQEGPPVIRQPPIPLYPHPVSYESAGDSKNPVLAQPLPRQQGSYRKHRHVPQKHPDTVDSVPYDDGSEGQQGYVGYASYKRKAPNTAVLANIRQNIRDIVTAPPPSYAKPVRKSEPVAFPNEKNEEPEEPQIRQYGSHLGKTPPHQGSVNPEPVYPPVKDDGRRYSQVKPIAGLPYPTSSPNVQRPASNHQKYQHYQNYPDRVNSKQPKRYPEPDYGLDYVDEEEKQIASGLDALSALLRPRNRQTNIYIQPQQVSQQPSTNKKKKISYSPVVLLTSGPSNNNKAVDIWYTRRPEK